MKKESVKKNKFINLNFKILTEFIGSSTRFELTPAVGPLKKGLWGLMCDKAYGSLRVRAGTLRWG